MHDFINLCARAAPDLPPSLGWVGAGVVLILAAAAGIDLVRGIVPDGLIAAGFALLIGALGWHHELALAAHLIVWGFTSAFVVWAVNRLWRFGLGHDALGMGDGKWTALAVACFGWPAGLYAWGGGALLATGMLIIARLVRRPIAQVHFAPFLLIGLIGGIYWMRLRFL